MPHTFLQTWEWRLSQEVMGNKPFNLGVFDKDELIGVAFVYKVIARRGTFLFCPHGPLIINDNQTALQVLVEFLKSIAKTEQADFVRISPLGVKTESALLKYKELGFRAAPIHMHPEHAWILNIELSEAELLKGMKKRTRYSITKAQKDGVEIFKTNQLDELENFYNIYMETANRQVFTPFSKEYVKREFEIFSQANKILLFFAKYQGEIIATAMIIYSNGSGFYHHGASTRNRSSITASELLQWEAIKEAKLRGFKLYNFWGIAPESLPNHPWAGLSLFKKGFGGFLEEYLPAQDYPLTLKYWLNYLVETVRRKRRGY